MKKHMFPKTVRNQIIVSTAAVTLIIAAITVTICFSVFQSFSPKSGDSVRGIQYAGYLQQRFG